jgi:hypothetical protein
MALSQSLKFQPTIVEKIVTLGTTTGTVVGPAVPAGSVVLSAGIEFITAPGSAGTSSTVAIGDGTTANLAATDMQAQAAGTILGGVVPSFISAADTIDAIQVVTGAGLVAATARVWAVVCNVNDCTKAAAEVDRDTLA